MSKIVLKSLSILLGSFFIFLGVLKITPRISKDLHKDLRTEYAKYAKVFPLAKLLDFKLPSKWYRRVVGGLEIVSGFLMVLHFIIYNFCRTFILFQNQILYSLFTHKIINCVLDGPCTWKHG